jgi:transcriptional regulator with XRE-family HTH domain
MDKLKIYREKKKSWSQTKLSKVSGVPQSTISEIENGIRKNPTFKTISKLAKALGESMEVMLLKE